MERYIKKYSKRQWAAAPRNPLPIPVEKAVLRAAAIVKSSGSNARKLPKSETESQKFMSRPTPDQWRNAIEPTTKGAINSADAFNKKNADLVSNMHKIMNSSSGKITESVVNTVGKRREKIDKMKNGRMKPERFMGLVKAVSFGKENDVEKIAKEHKNLLDKMDARIVKEFLAAPKLEKVMMRERQKLRTVGTWPETNKA